MGDIMNKKAYILLPLIAKSLIVSNTCFGAELYKIHILKKGETLSELLQKNGYTPLYGEGQWVQKTLDFNHLESPDDKRIKEGFPIILPKKEKAHSLSTSRKEDFVKVESAAPLRQGLLGNQISQHQDLYLNLNYQQKNLNSKSKINRKISNKESFGLSVAVQGKNNYRISDLIYNFDYKIGIQALGSGIESENTNYNFQPTYYTQFLTDLRKYNSDFHFKPSIEIERVTQLDSDKNNQSELRRDQNIWLGLGLVKDIEWKHLDIKVGGQYQTLLTSQNINSNSNFDGYKNGQRLNFYSDINLTKNYYIGVFSHSIFLEGEGKLLDDSFGLSLKYNIK